MSHSSAVWHFQFSKDDFERSLNGMLTNLKLLRTISMDSQQRLYFVLVSLLCT